jgi:hypothetical protein
VTAINGLMPANAILASSALGVVTLTAEVKGQGFQTGVGSKTGTGIALTSSTSGTLSTDLNRSILGISHRDVAVALTSVAQTEPAYRANSLMRVARRGELWVASSQTISQFEPVYVETAIGDDSGKCFNTGSATRVLCPKLRWIHDSTDADKAVVQIAA